MESGDGDDGGGKCHGQTWAGVLNGLEGRDRSMLQHYAARYVEELDRYHIRPSHLNLTHHF